MTLGTSLLLIAIGAILRFAVNVSTSGFNVHTVGVILMIVGAVGLILSLLYMTMWDRRERVVRDRAVVYDDPDVPPSRRVR
jgi:membrane-bound ClpP family serine protease